MQVPKVIGADVELGNFLVGVESIAGTGAFAARALLDEFAGVPDRASTREAHPRIAIAGPVTLADARPSRTLGGNPCEWGRTYLPGCAGCVYIDADHLELALPECRDAWSHVAHFHAMLRLVQRAQRAAQAKLPAGVTLEVLANTSDGLGQSYGAHLDMLVARETLDDLLERKPHYLGWLASFQVSAIVVSGQGKVGAEHDHPHVDFQLSQRADFFEQLSSVDTMARRGLVNRRKEPLCGARSDLARLHVIFFDDMLAHVARLVTVGSLQIALSMLEAGCVSPALMLESPLDALHAWSRDPSLRATAPLVGGRRVTIVELQRLFFEDASRFVAQGRCEGFVARAAEIIAHWDAVLGALERRDRDALATKLDWALKLTLLEGAMGRHPRLTWQSPEIKALDHRYASLGAGGLFLARDAAGGIERVVGAAEVEHAMTEPPDDHACMDARHAAASLGQRGRRHRLGSHRLRGRRALVTAPLHRRPRRPGGLHQAAVCPPVRGRRLPGRRRERPGHGPPVGVAGRMEGHTMESRQQRRPVDPPVPLVGGSDDQGDTRLDRLRSAERLLAAADEAIDRALSSDSAQFLRAARQTGGQ